MSKTATAAKPQNETKPAVARPAVQPGTAVTAASGQSVRSVLYDMAERFGMEPAAFEATLRHTVIPKDCSREQFAAFLLVAKEYSLNPLLKEIYAFPAKGGGIQPIVGVDGWSNLVNSHPAFDGMEFDDKLDGQGNLIAVTCRMFRKDRSHAVSATEYMAECKRNTEPWTKWPRRMLRHKSMIQAARYAFGFAGIVDPDEAERFAAETARDVTPRRTVSAAQAFDEFSRGGDAEAGELSDPPPADTGLDSEFEDDAAQPQADQQPAGDQGGHAAGKTEQQPTEAKNPGIGEPAKPDDKAGEKTGEPDKKPEAATWPKDQVPKTQEEYHQYAAAHLGAETNAKAIPDWFKSEGERKLRNACGVTKDTFDAVKAIASNRIAELGKA